MEDYPPTPGPRYRRVILVSLTLVAVSIVLVGAKDTNGEPVGSSHAYSTAIESARSTTLVTPDRKVVILHPDGTWRYALSSGSALERWKSLSLGADLIEQFRGAFESLGVRIIDTGETLTVRHRGDHIDFAPGLDQAAVDTTVEIYGYQAERLASKIESGTVDEVEWFRVARVLWVSGAEKGVVQNPLSSHGFFRRFIQAKDLVHVFLVSPDPKQESDATSTLIYVNGAYLLVPGLHGKPERVFRVTVADALELQRKFVEAKHAGWSERIKLARWYVDWRKKVEVPR